MKPGIDFEVRDPHAGTYSVSALAAVTAVVLGILVWYWDVAAAMVAIWHRSETFAHGFLVVPVSLWLAWRKREALARLSARPFYPALAVVAASGFVWMLAALASVAGVQQFALVVALIAAIVAVVGLPIARELAFPLAFLLFAVPAGEFLVPWMIDRTADFTIAALRATGIPVLREGNNFVIPSGSWAVVEACSGIRYLIASLVGGALYAHLYFRSRARQLAVLAASIVVPLVANWLRAYMIVMLGHLSGNRIAVGVDHLIYGWIFFGVVMFLFFWVASFWREDDAPPARPAAARPLAQALAVPARGTALFGAALLAVLAAALWRPVDTMLEARASMRPTTLATIEPAAGWTAGAPQLSDWGPRFVGPRALRSETFARGDARVGLYLGFYRGQDQGSELVNAMNQLAPTSDDRWVQIHAGTRALSWLGAETRVRTAVIRGRADTLRVRQLYWIGGETTTSDVRAKLMLALSKLRGRGDDSAVIIFHTVAGNDPAGADRTLDDFARDMAPAIDAALRRTAAGR